MQPLCLTVSVPVAGFRVAHAREYWETYPCPPPSTVYGMLLSLVGEPDRLVHRGTEVAIALLTRPDRSAVLRTLWRVKDRNAPLGLGENARPDYQELLTGLELAIWVRPGTDHPPLLDRLTQALRDPSGVTRFGGLALGESSHMVDEVRPRRAGDPEAGELLVADERGDLSLPIWPDHVGSKGTRWGQFRLEPRELPVDGEVPDDAWVCIKPPDGEPA